jgi:signal transduction histidine kinase
LTVLKLDLSKLRKLVPAADQELQAKLEACLASIHSMAQMVRRIATDLRPAILDEFGLLAAIEWQVQEFQNHSGIQSELHSNVELITLDHESSTAVFRVLQEALTNVARHAQASRVHIRIEKQPDYLLLQIQDNGRGFDERDLAGTKSLGLLGMRERFRLLSGQLDIHSSPGNGTTVQIRIPENTV